MIVPYFYLEVGEIKILQPQNKKIKFSKTAHINGDVFQISSMDEPQVRGNILFVNGRSAKNSYNFLKLKDNSSQIIEAINFINRMYNDV